MRNQHQSSRCSATSSGSFDAYAGVGVACATLCLLLFATLCRCSSLLLLKAALRSSRTTVGTGSQGNSAANIDENLNYHIMEYYKVQIQMFPWVKYA